MKKLFVLLLLLITKVSIAQDFTALAEKSLPKVVSITSKFENKEVVGSGFIIDETGLIVTNNHVIDGAYHINVVVNNNQNFTAKVKGKDDVLDIALIKIEPYELLPSINYANSDNIKIGQWAMAVGNPFGVGNSVSVGIISAKSRDIQSSSYDNFIQTDAAINMGNSGGPLFDINGDVIGMTTAMFSKDEKSSGVGFALPSNQIKDIVAQLKKNGLIKRGWIGIKITPITNGVKISEIFENSPLYNSQIKVGDKIVKINNTLIKNPTDLSNAIALAKINTKAKITTETGTFEVVVIEKPQETTKENNIKTCFALQMELSNNNLELINITNNSDAYIKGLKTGDKIKSFDNNVISNCKELNSYLLEAKRVGKTSLMTQINTNDGNTHFVELKI